jgi:hypothetical protein
VAEFDRRGWVRSLANYRIMGWVGVSYGGVRGLEIAARVRICSTIKPRGIRGQTRVWHSEARHGVCVPLPIHAGCSLLWRPKIRIRALNGGSVVKVIHRLGRGVWH